MRKSPPSLWCENSFSEHINLYRKVIDKEKHCWYYYIDIHLCMGSGPFS